MEGEGNRFSLRPRQIFSTLNKVVPTRLAVNPTIQIRVERYSTLFPFHPIPGFYAFGFGCTRTPKPRPGARRRRDADEIGISMRVIVGSPGAGQYRVFSSVREHSKHRATMAQNGRQLPDTLLSREPPPPSLSLYLSISLRWRSTGRRRERVHCWTSEVLMENFLEYIYTNHVMENFKVFEQKSICLFIYLFIVFCSIIYF